MTFAVRYYLYLLHAERPVFAYSLALVDYVSAVRYPCFTSFVLTVSVSRESGFQYTYSVWSE